MRRSSKAIDETASRRAVWRGRTAPDPGRGVAIELGGSDAGGVGDVLSVGQRDAGKGFAAEEPPPALDEVELGSANRDEGVLDARMVGQPVPNRATALARQVVRHQIEVALRIRLVQRLEHGEIARRVA